MTRRRRRDAEKEALWRRVIAEQAESGKSIRKFCMHKDVHEAQFYAWRREIALRDRESGKERSEPVPDFLPIQVIERAKNNFECPIEIVSPDGWRVRVANGASSSQVAELLDRLQQLGQAQRPSR